MTRLSITRAQKAGPQKIGHVSVLRRAATRVSTERGNPTAGAIGVEVRTDRTHGVCGEPGIRMGHNRVPTPNPPHRFQGRRRVAVQPPQGVLPPRGPPSPPLSRGWMALPPATSSDFFVEVTPLGRSLTGVLLAHTSDNSINCCPGLNVAADFRWQPVSGADRPGLGPSDGWISDNLMDQSG